jgi:membrane protease YdiL (CAAX protease family)
VRITETRDASLLDEALLSTTRAYQPLQPADESAPEGAEHEPQQSTDADGAAVHDGTVADGSGLALIAFFTLAIAWSWAWWIPLAVSGEVVARGAGWPTHVPGLFGPMLAALVVLASFGRSRALAAWARSLTRVPRDARWLTVAIAPLAFLTLGLAVAALAGGLPPAKDFTRFSGMAPGAALLILLLGAWGEEAGWRGFALPRLQARLGALRATLLLAMLWALWHAPLFLIVQGYRDFSPMTVPGFLIGLTAGALVLTAIFNHTGGSVLAVALWHAIYNISSASDGDDGAVAAIVTACVIVWGMRLLARERRGDPALGYARVRRRSIGHEPRTAS